MRTGWVYRFGLIVLIFSANCFGISRDKAKAFSGQDMHLFGEQLTSWSEDDEHVLLFDGCFSLEVGANCFSSERAIVWISSKESGYLGRADKTYKVRVFLDGAVKLKKGRTAKATDIRETVIDHGDSLMAGFNVAGEVFVTSDKRVEQDFRECEIYKKASKYLAPRSLLCGIAKDALVPTKSSIARAKKAAAEKEEKVKEDGGFSWFMPEKEAEASGVEPDMEVVKPEEVVYQYPINIAGVWEPAPTLEKTTLEDGTNVATVIGRFYLWQKQNDEGDLLEFQADNAVVFYSGEGFKIGAEQTKSDELLASGSVKAVYIQGNIVMTEGSRTVRADELYYDFEDRQALAINAEYRSFDKKRGIPIYIRACEMMQVKEGVFTANDITLTSDEFYMPQISTTASSILVTDTTNFEARNEQQAKKGKFDAQINDIRLKVGEATIFSWPKLRSNVERPDLPIKKLHVAQDNSFGTGVETDWYLARLLGIYEPEGFESTLNLDYYSKRGFGAGADFEYSNDEYFGYLLGYAIKDSGEDRLGRIDSRKDLDPNKDIRGRVLFRHRHYLPYDWQITMEAGYLSDRNFLESFYRDEFNTGKDQETLLHMKRLKDNWAFSFLTKGRINDFQDELEELPTAQFHMAGQDLFGGLMTYYTDSKAGRFRYRYDDEGPGGDEDFFTFASTRHEIDMPLCWGKGKIVPFVAGTFAFDDSDAFDTGLNGKAVDPEDKLWLGEAGLRYSTMFWKTDQFLRSRIWDLNGMRHTIRPHAELVVYDQSDDAIEMRDIVNVGLAQRWQTRRGNPGNLRTVDWMSLDVDATWVKDSDDATTGPNRFIFDDPTIPIFDRRTTDDYGVRRNSIQADYKWRVSDTLAMLSDLNYDMQSGVVQQFDVGVSRYCWPNLSYYIGSRYLNRVILTDNNEYYEKGTNALNFAVTYKINPRYTVVFSQEYDFDFEQNVRSELALIRRYHRMYYGFTISVDESLDRNAITFSIWPEGIKELAVGSRRYYGLGQSEIYN